MLWTGCRARLSLPVTAQVKGNVSRTCPRAGRKAPEGLSDHEEQGSPVAGVIPGRSGWSKAAAEAWRRRLDSVPAGSGEALFVSDSLRLQQHVGEARKSQNQTVETRLSVTAWVWR